jgi:hypothetical protein
MTLFSQDYSGGTFPRQSRVYSGKNGLTSPLLLKNPGKKMFFILKRQISPRPNSMFWVLRGVLQAKFLNNLLALLKKKKGGKGFFNFWGFWETNKTGGVFF